MNFEDFQKMHEANLRHSAACLTTEQKKAIENALNQGVNNIACKLGLTKSFVDAYIALGNLGQL